MHAAIGQDLEALEDNTISVVLEAITSMKHGMKMVMGEDDANSKVLTQAKTLLPNLIIKLEKFK
jgi:hypothetical protein